MGGEDNRHPLTLFVGRGPEQRQLLMAIGGAGSSRQVIGGPPGVGKTTLIQRVKGAALGGGYFATDRLVPFFPDDTAELVLGRLLAGIYDAILTARPMTANHPAMQAAQQIVRVVRLGSGGLSVSAMGFGIGGSAGSTPVTPPLALLVDGPRIIRDLLALVRMTGARGIVLHLNNLENLGEADAANAADVLRSLRDPVLLQDGLHILLVGTGEAVLAVTQRHAQLRSVFAAPLLLSPLPATDVAALLAARYDGLRLDATQPVVPPVAPAAVEALYPLFRGDLRALLKALEEGAGLLLGVAPTPLTLADLQPALRQRYSAQLDATLERARVRQLTAWGASVPGTEQTQRKLETLWKLSQAAVSRALGDLMQAGYVVALPREGAEQGRYVLSGTSRLIFG